MALLAQPVTIPATDGVPLAATTFPPPLDGKTTVVISPATGVGQGFYRPFAEYLAGEGFTVVTFDYRGIGRSPLPGSPRDARMRHWGARDLAAVLAWVVRTRPGDRLLVVGHSAGGQLLGLALHGHRVAGLLGIAAQSGYYGHWSGVGRLALWMLWTTVIPVTTAVLGYVPGWVFGSRMRLPGGVAQEWARWCLHPDYLLAYLDEDRAEHYRGFRAPILAMAFSDDPYAPPTAVAALLSFYPNAAGRMQIVRPVEVGMKSLGHFGFFRPAARDTLWAQAARWLRDPTA